MTGHVFVARQTEAETPMTLFKNLSRLVAATAAMALLVAPIASADQGRRGDGYRGDKHRSVQHRDHRRSDYRRDDRRSDYRRSDRRHRSDYHRDDRRGRGDYYRDQRRYSNFHRRPVVVHHPAPRYYAPPRVHYSYSSRPIQYGRYYRDGYRSRYNVGGYYAPHRRTVYLSDYHHYGLYDPPRGYHWVRDYDRGDAILASVATGAIIGLVVGAIAYD